MGIAKAISAWALASFLFGLVAGRFIRICRENSPGPREVPDEPGVQAPRAEADEPDAVTGLRQH
jgi:hypothetical protein